MTTTTTQAAAVLLAACALATCGGGAPSPPPWAARLGYEPGELHPIEVGRYGYAYVRARIDGADLALALDTADMTELSLAKRVVERLRLPLVERTTLVDADGSPKGEARILGVARFEALGRTWNEVRARERAEDEIDGLIGPRYLRTGRFTLDYGRGVLGVSDRPLPRLLAGDERLERVASAELPLLLVVRGAVGAREVLVQLDTGKSRTCVDPALAAELGLGATSDGVRLAGLRLGSRRFDVASAKLVGFAGISAGLPEPILVGAGSDVLSQVLLSVSYAEGEVRLSR